MHSYCSRREEFTPVKRQVQLLYHQLHARILPHTPSLLPLSSALNQYLPPRAALLLALPMQRPLRDVVQKRYFFGSIDRML